jgi:4-hydroxybenzoate polyprenyltransferase
VTQNSTSPEVGPALGRQRVKCAIKLLRFRDWSVQNGVFLLGAFFADSFLAHPLDFILASLALSCLCLAYGYSLNEFFDVLKPQVDEASAKALHRFIYILLTGALLVAWFISILAFCTVALIGITVWLHSSPPFRLKKGLFCRFFLNSLGFGLFFLAGAALDNRLSPAELAMGVFIFGLYLPLELIHVLAHMESDRSSNLPTFALVHGERKTVYLAILILAGLITYLGVLWWLRFATIGIAAWSILTLCALLIALVAFYKRANRYEPYRKLRQQAKVICALYGVGLLVILGARI